MIEDSDSNHIRDSQAMSTPARLSDGHRLRLNWLNCNLALDVMRRALQDYINNEVTKLHGHIKHKVCSIHSGSSIDSQCGSCSSQDIKLTEGKTWYINCHNSICDKWLHEILAIHNDPHKPTINWKNADISKWPTDCYQVAKIFMPRGQDKAIKMPDDLNLPAILSLMKDCNWFRKDLPDAQILSDLIVIRKYSVHDSDMKVLESDKDRWIDLMIQLLHDLNISGDAQAELQKLKNSPVEEEQRFITAVEEQMNVQLSLQRGTTLSGLNSEFECPPLLPEGKDYHAYFLYRTLSSDRDWVKEVISRLEKDGLRCGFHERDFIPGQTIISNITDALKKSQKVVLVISPDFHQSEWTKYETELATMFSIEQSPSRLSVIPVLLRDCEIPDCLKNLTYLDAQMEERIWWPRLKKAIMCKFGKSSFPSFFNLIVYHIRHLFLSLIKRKLIWRP